ncbi:MAG TPA: pitrilysin family protein [Thermoanaerobaculia bacterium]|nr:pitrilysin family protein [Thermoanaerobaculia bacterium]
MISAAVALSAATVVAQKQAPPAPGPAKNFTLPEVRKFDLPNGMRVRLVHYGDVPKVTIRVVEQTGNVDEGPNEIWLADLTGEMIQQGTTTRSPEDIQREIASMGGTLDVNTGVNQTSIATDVFTESATRAVDLIADVVRNPRFPESELARLKGDLARQLSIAQSQPQQITTAKFLSVLYPNQVYGRYFPTAPMLQGYTLDQVKNFYATNFGARRAAIYVAGVFDDAAVERQIRNDFSSWTAGAPPTAVAITPSMQRALYLLDRPGAVQSTVFIGLPALDPSSPDYLQATVMNALLGGSFGSRITSNIREQKGYTYSPFSQLATRLHAGYWVEVADVKTDVTGPSIKEILGEIERLRNAPPSAEELRGIQNYLAGTFVLRNSSREGIVNQLAFLDLYGLPEDYLRTYVQKVYATTPADIQRIAQTYLDPSKMSIVVAGDRKVIAEQLNPYGPIIE